MNVGVVFPQTEIEPDPGAIRAYTEAVSELGFEHVLVYDHVLGVDTDVVRDWDERARSTGATSAKPYNVADRFHEVMVLFGFLAAVCDLELVSGVLVAPQRQTPLIAKQAAEVDLLCGGRLRLGLGIGWNALESRAMGFDFATRGRRLDEQVVLLRRLWTERSPMDGLGIAPPPVQRPIPIWLGAGAAPRALERVGRLADGWLPVSVAPAELGDQLDSIRGAATAAGRDPAAIGLEGRIEAVGPGHMERAVADADAWRALGATHVAVNTMRAGLDGVDAHVDVLRQAAPALIG
jgi:probable F420-dependent oxidoreductase